MDSSRSQSPVSPLAPLASQVDDPEIFDLATYLSQEKLFLPCRSPSPPCDPDEEESNRFILVEDAIFDNNAQNEEDDPLEGIVENEETEISDIENLLPPLTGYSSNLNNKELVKRLNTVCAEKAYGYAIVNSRSRPEKNSYEFSCDRGHTYRNTHRLDEDQRRRQRTTTRAIKCPFKLTGKRIGNEWVIQVKNPTHNHSLSSDSRAHPMHRCRALDPEAHKIVIEAFKAAVPPRVVYTILLERFGQCPLTDKDLYNMSNRLMRKELGGYSPIQALLNEILSDNSAIISRILKDEKNRITHLFLIYKKSIEVLRENYDILLLDCTYKTNRYRMPLLNILFVTKLHTTMNLGFIFMNREKEDDYK